MARPRSEELFAKRSSVSGKGPGLRWFSRFGRPRGAFGASLAGLVRFDTKVPQFSRKDSQAVSKPPRTFGSAETDLPLGHPYCEKNLAKFWQGLLNLRSSRASRCGFSRLGNTRRSVRHVDVWPLVGYSQNLRERDSPLWCISNKCHVCSLVTCISPPRLVQCPVY